MVTVQSESNVPVYLIRNALASSEAPSATVDACVSALVVMASVPIPSASPINSKDVLVDVPHPESPSAGSATLKLFTYVDAIIYAAISVQLGVCAVSTTLQISTPGGASIVADMPVTSTDTPVPAVISTSLTSPDAAIPTIMTDPPVPAETVTLPMAEVPAEPDGIQ